MIQINRQALRAVSLFSFVRAREALNGTKSGTTGTMQVHHNGNGPALVDIDDSNFVGVIMPWRTAPASSNVPAWFKDELEQQIDGEQFIAEHPEIAKENEDSKLAITA